MTAAPPAITLLRPESLTALAAQQIERLILGGAIAAGSRINEQALAAQLGISRGPVREAIRGLERSGLVVTVVNQGSYVRKVSVEEALELYDLRALLTGHACESLAAAAPPGAEARLESLVAQMEQAASAHDAPSYYALNLEFHAALLECGSGPRSQRIYADLGNELHLFRRRALVAPEKMRESNAEHAAILSAIRDRNPGAARGAGEAHIRGGKRRFAASTPGTSRPPETAAGGNNHDPDQAAQHDPPPDPVAPDTCRAGAPPPPRRRRR
jgi:DNA-binding GntR family transcriptional regulator